MNSFNDWGSVILASFQDLWDSLVGYLPALIAAVIILLVGMFISNMLAKGITKFLSQAYLDRAVESTGLKSVLARLGFKMEISEALGLLIKWFLYAVFLIAASDILGLSQISEFLHSVVLYIPNVIIAVVILVVGVIASRFVQTFVKEAATAANLEVSDFLSDVARWAILVFTIMAAMVQLNVATQLTEILFMGFVFMVSLAGGIAFGFGGQEKAKKIIDKLSR